MAHFETLIVGEAEDFQPAQKGVVLLIPAYKPSASLPELIRSVRDYDSSGIIAAVLVVDDGSGPEFGPVFRAAKTEAGAIVISHAVNLGKGAALKSGFNHALLRWTTASGIVTADADGQHAPRDILRVASELSEHPDQLVLGARKFTRGVPFRSRFGNTTTRLVFRAFTGLALADTQTGLRGWPRALCLSSLRIPVNGYDVETECMVRARSQGSLARVREIPIETIYLDGNSSSHFNPLRDSMRIYYVFLRYCGSSAITAAVDYLAFFLILSRTGSLASSQFGARAFAVLVSFWLAHRLVFQSSKSRLRSFLQFMLLVSVMGTISYALITLMRDHLGMGMLAAKILAESALFAGNFTIQREFIFAKR